MFLLNPSKTSICPAFETEAATVCVLWKRCSYRFRKFHRKDLWWSLFNKIAGLQACNVIKTMLQHRYFLWNLQYLLRVPVLKNICKRLLLEKDFLDVVESFQKIYSVGRLWMVGFFSFNFNCFQLFQSVFSYFNSYKDFLQLRLSEL